MSVQVTKLANGMRVVTDRMDLVETVSIGVWVDVGTRHEPAAINGVAHLLEHMAFKGTEKRSALAIASEIEAVGGHVNAYTSREHTAYYAKVLKADTGLAVDILSDILQHSAFDAGELERERTVISQDSARHRTRLTTSSTTCSKRLRSPINQWASRCSAAPRSSRASSATPSPAICTAPMPRPAC